MNRTLHNTKTKHTCQVLADGPEQLRLRFTLPSYSEGAPLHYHRVMEERFTVIEGELSVEWELAGNWRTLRPGDSILILPGQRHGFANRSSQPLVFEADIAHPGRFLRFIETIYRNPSVFGVLRASVAGDVWPASLPTMNWVAMLLILFPLLIQVPYTLLVTQFNYPHILREPAGVILERYFAAGTSLPLIWASFALSIVPLLLAIAALPSRLPKLPTFATPLGVASALVQIIGLLRWSLVVPMLASAHHGNAADRATIEWNFALQHQVLGVMLGEQLGQFLLAIWTLAVAVTVVRFRLLGVLSGLLFLASALIAVEPLGTVAFLTWSIWCVLLGWQLLPVAPVLGRRALEPAPEVAMQHAGF